MNLGLKGTVGTPKETLKCWECGEPHLQRNFPLFNEKNRFFHNFQEVSTVGEFGKIFHRINATLEDPQEDNQSTIVEIKGTSSNKRFSILIDPWDTLSYITPKMMDNYQLAKLSHAKSWSFQLATREKRKVTNFIANCEFKFQDHVNSINLDILHLGSYDMIIGIDWLKGIK